MLRLAGALVHRLFALPFIGFLLYALFFVTNVLLAHVYSSYMEEVKAQAKEFGQNRKASLVAVAMGAPTARLLTPSLISDGNTWQRKTKWDTVQGCGRTTPVPVVTVRTWPSRCFSATRPTMWQQPARPPLLAPGWASF